MSNDLWTRLTCTRCGKPIAVMQIPPGHLDAREYVCLDCLEDGRKS